MARAAAAGLIAALGSVTAFAVTASSQAEDPPATETTETIYQTVTETVARRILERVDGKRVQWWARRARANGHRMRARTRQLSAVQRALRATVTLGGASGLERAFLCVHSHEGSWQDPGAPYYGGLQMDSSFMATYGGPYLRAFGTADRWTPAMQIATAERAYLAGRGWSPWPNTARMCGLLP
jgi:hypothetical protein